MRIPLTARIDEHDFSERDFSVAPVFIGRVCWSPGRVGDCSTNRPTVLSVRLCMNRFLGVNDKVQGLPLQLASHYFIRIPDTKSPSSGQRERLFVNPKGARSGVVAVRHWSYGVRITRRVRVLERIVNAASCYYAVALR